jgi:hypothetical protein
VDACRDLGLPGDLQVAQRGDNTCPHGRNRGSLATGTYFVVITPVFTNAPWIASFEQGKGSEPSVAVTGPNGSIAVTWTTVAGATSYNVYYGTTAGAEAVLVNVVGTSVTLTTLTVGGSVISGTPPKQTGWDQWGLAQDSSSFPRWVAALGAAAGAWLYGQDDGVLTNSVWAWTVDSQVFFASTTTPVGLILTPSTTGGSLATATYFVKISAIMQDGYEYAAGVESSAAVTGPTGSIAASWTAVAGAKSYRIYLGTATGAENTFFTSTTNSFTITTSTGTSGTPLTAPSAGAIIQTAPAASSVAIGLAISATEVLMFPPLPGSVQTIISANPGIAVTNPSGPTTTLTVPMTGTVAGLKVAAQYQGAGAPAAATLAAGSYNVGDTYVNTSTGDFWVCKTAGTASTSVWLQQDTVGSASNVLNQQMNQAVTNTTIETTLFTFTMSANSIASGQILEFIVEMTKETLGNSLAVTLNFYVDGVKFCAYVGAATVQTGLIKVLIIQTPNSAAIANFSMEVIENTGTGIGGTAPVTTTSINVRQEAYLVSQAFDITLSHTFALKVVLSTAIVNVGVDRGSWTVRKS